MHLQVNREKSAVAPVEKRSFLDHRLLPDGRLGLAPKSLARAKKRRRRITKRNRGIASGRMISQANAFPLGRVTYVRHAPCKRELRRLDQWRRQRLRLRAHQAR